MSFMFDVPMAKQLVNKALDYRSLRQDLISSNIANVDTPFYRPKDINFENVLTKKSEELFKKKTDPELKLAKTSQAHLSKANTFDTNKATIFFRDGHMARNDGNSVDIDVETTQMSKNNIMYSSLVSASNVFKNIEKYALESSKSL